METVFGGERRLEHNGLVESKDIMFFTILFIDLNQYLVYFRFAVLIGLAGLMKPTMQVVSEGLGSALISNISFIINLPIIKVSRVVNRPKINKKYIILIEK